MEVERENGERTVSGTTSAQVNAPTQSRGEDVDGHRLKEPEGDEGANSEAFDGAVEPRQETLITNTQDSADCLPMSPLPTEEEVTPPVSSHPSNAQNQPSEPCWYCLRSLNPEYRPETPKQDSEPLSPLPSSGHTVSYQTDPRPHFGVAWSSHSPCRPLWGNEGPCWGQRNQEMPIQMHTCPHCHLGLPPDTLRWHEAKCLLFDSVRNSDK